MKTIVEFIALDSVNRALQFYDKIIFKIQNISDNPYAYRKREDDEDLKELIFKGYTIPFEIDKKKNKIVILGIFNQNAWK
ncbi:MAG: hypothetical protein AUK54_08885 [Helicobacteraceae bacterium CG2_30_36_10]|nr:MAG: hypothetical protein AUK54_08885 [Helicobacteraceae bacterium CG2_30_36_10]